MSKTLHHSNWVNCHKSPHYLLFNCIYAVDSWFFHIICHDFRLAESHDSQCMIVMFSESCFCLLSVLTAVSADLASDLLWWWRILKSVFNSVSDWRLICQLCDNHQWSVFRMISLQFLNINLNEEISSEQQLLKIKTFNEWFQNKFNFLAKKLNHLTVTESSQWNTAAFKTSSKSFIKTVTWVSLSWENMMCFWESFRLICQSTCHVICWDLQNNCS